MRKYWIVKNADGIILAKIYDGFGYVHTEDMVKAITSLAFEEEFEDTDCVIESGEEK